MLDVTVGDAWQKCPWGRGYLVWIGVGTKFFPTT